MSGLGPALTRTRNRTILATALLLGCLACGDGALHSLGATDETTAPAPGNGHPIAAEDYVLTEGAETVGLTADVSPDTPASSSDPAGLDTDRLGTCLGLAPTALDNKPLSEASGVNFHNGAETLFVTSSAEVDTPQQAKSLMAALSSPNLVACENEAIVAAGLTDKISGVTSTTVPANALGAIRMTIDRSDSFETPLVTDIIALGRGVVTCTLMVTATQGLPSIDLENRLVPQIIRKMLNQ